jgi:chromosome segregation ATPase
MTKSEYQQLVEFIAPRFDRLENRLDGVENRLESVENRLEAVENRLESVENRLESVENRLESVENRLESVETRLTRVEVRVEENRHLIQIVAEGLTAFREETRREFDALRKELAHRFELHEIALRNLNGRMDRWEAH